MLPLDGPHRRGGKSLLAGALSVTPPAWEPFDEGGHMHDGHILLYHR